MNFLNKKHVQSFANTNKGLSQLSSSQQHQEESSFSPYTGSYINNRTQQMSKGLQFKQSPTQIYQSSSRVVEREVSQYSSTYGQKIHSKSSLPPPSTNLPSANICQQHENQILRHLCLQCNQLLCSQCISEHLQSHRQRTNTIPKISTINKLKKQMNIKAEKILQFMDDNNPKALLSDISQLKYEAITKIHDMKEEVIKAFQEWCKVLERHVIEDMIEENALVDLSNNMGKMKEEVLGLYNDILGSQNINAQTIKKVQGIDQQRLQAGYLQMFNQFSRTVLKSKFVFDIDWTGLMAAFEKGIVLRAVHTQNKVNVKNKDKINYSESQNSVLQNVNIEINEMETNSIVERPVQDQLEQVEIHSIESQTSRNQNADIPLIRRASREHFQHKQSNQDKNTGNKEQQYRLTREDSSKQRLPIFATSNHQPEQQQNHKQTIDNNNKNNDIFDCNDKN